VKHRLSLLRIGLGLAAGAVLQWAPLAVTAQVVPPPASEVPVPPKPESDSVTAVRDTVPRDTIKAPIGRVALPAAPGIAGGYRWSGDTIVATGAYTLTDLLARIPELTAFRSAWIASPQTVALAGDFVRVRIFVDDVELDAFDPRDRGVHDLAHVPIWALDNVVIERAAGEIRVHLRTWSVNRTTPYTRTDVYTGNEETDIYRGFYGKRFTNGVVFQAGAEQSATENLRVGGGGDALSLLLRFGVGKRLWSLDGFAERTHYHRARQVGIAVPTLSSYDATHTIAYVRAAAGRAERGPWIELIAANHRVKESSPHLDSLRALSLGVPRDTLDTSLTRIQYVARGGMRVGPAALTLTDRIRRYSGQTFNDISARLDFSTRWASATLFAETGGESPISTTDAQLQILPLPFVSIGGAIQKYHTNSPLFPSGVSKRGEIGIRLLGLWAYGGAIGIEDERLLAPLIYDTAYARTRTGDRSGVFAGLRGRGWRGLGADAYVIKWDSGAQYLPQYQARAELNFQTEWRSRFPRGEFSFNAAVADELRSSVLFPLRDGSIRRTGARHVLWGLMEIRIQRAVLSFQFRNPLGKSYFLVPGFEMPRAVSTYGVRWFFWN
jgi:hypothetical protein